jgi:hypothetical protein
LSSNGIAFSRKSARKASTTYYPHLHLELARYISLALSASYQLPYPVSRLIEPPPDHLRLRPDGQFAMPLPSQGLKGGKHGPVAPPLSLEQQQLGQRLPPQQQSAKRAPPANSPRHEASLLAPGAVGGQVAAALLPANSLVLDERFIFQARGSAVMGSAAVKGSSGGAPQLTRDIVDRESKQDSFWD